MKLIPFSLMCSVLLLPQLSNANDDEYDYIATPVAKQTADHLDDDHDGVINERDLCVGTIKNSLVNNDGCGSFLNSKQEMQLRVLFANDSDEINPIFNTQIKQLAKFLSEYPTTSIEILGFASKIGDTKHNLNLSQRRATNDQLFLIVYHQYHT